MNTHNRCPDLCYEHPIELMRYMRVIYKRPDDPKGESARSPQPIIQPPQQVKAHA